MFSRPSLLRPSSCLCSLSSLRFSRSWTFSWFFSAYCFSCYCCAKSICFRPFPYSLRRSWASAFALRTFSASYRCSSFFSDSNLYFSFSCARSFFKVFTACFWSSLLSSPHLPSNRFPANGISAFCFSTAGSSFFLGKKWLTFLAAVPVV